MINEIMSKNIIYGNIDSSIKDISILMKNNNIGFIPIKDKKNYVGVITDRDICLSLSNIKSLDDSIKPFMSKRLIYVDINNTINEVLNIMSKEKIKRILVKDKKSVMGVISLSDILMYYNNNKILDTIKDIFYIHDNRNIGSAEIDEFYL